MTTSSAPPLSPPSATPDAPSTSVSLSASIHLLQNSVNQLINHVRYLEYGVKMALPTAQLQEEFVSDRILFDLPDEDSDDGGAAVTAGSASDASTEPLFDSDAQTETGSASSNPGDDEPLVHRFKRSKPAP